MTTKSKRLYSIKRTIDFENETILFTCYDRDGNLLTDPRLNVHFNAKKASTAHRHSAMMMGYNHSIGDEAAQSQGATIVQKFEAMRERSSYCESGQDAWTTGRGPSETSLLFRALSIAYEAWTPVEVQKFITDQKSVAKTKEISWPAYQAKLLQSKKLAPIVEKLRAEEAEGLEVDVDGLFDELDAA